MRVRHWRTAVAATVVLLSLVGHAIADGRNPGSLLVFPEFDNTAGRRTFLTITNVNGDSAHGATRIEIDFINGAGPTPTLCSEANVTYPLSPNDTLTLLTSAVDPSHQQGYAYAFAKDATGRAIGFDFLIGDDLIVDGIFSLDYAVNPVTFRAIPGLGQPTDLDGDGIRDLNGLEYEPAPARILIPRFIAQTPGYQSELVLIALTGGAQFTTSLNFLAYNDNEEAFSHSFEFRCWTKVPLLTISASFSQSFLANYTNQDPSEIVGAPTIESGWIEIDGGLAYSSAAQFTDPAFLAVLSEHSGAGTGAETAFGVGTQTNGDLLPQGILGDSN